MQEEGKVEENTLPSSNYDVSGYLAGNVPVSDYGTAD